MSCRTLTCSHWCQGRRSLKSNVKRLSPGAEIFTRLRVELIRFDSRTRYCWNVERQLASTESGSVKKSHRAVLSSSGLRQRGKKSPTSFQSAVLHRDPLSIFFMLTSRGYYHAHFISDVRAGVHLLRLVVFSASAKEPLKTVLVSGAFLKISCISFVGRIRHSRRIRAVCLMRRLRVLSGLRFLHFFVGRIRRSRRIRHWLPDATLCVLSDLGLRITLQQHRLDMAMARVGFSPFGHTLTQFMMLDSGIR